MENQETNEPILVAEEKPAMPVVESTVKVESISTQRYRPLYRSSQIVWYIVALVEIILFFRFFLKLFGANPQAGFTMFIYGFTQIFAGPFLFVFRVTQTQGAIFEWSTLLAMVVYLLIGWLIVKALIMSKPVTTAEAEKKLPEQGKV